MSAGNTYSLDFSSYLAQLVVRRTLGLFAKQEIAKCAYQNMPLFCLLTSQFSSLLKFSEAEKQVMDKQTNSDFLACQQIRDTLRNSRLGSLADKLDITQASRAYALFSHGMSAARFQELFAEALDRLNMSESELKCPTFNTFALQTGLSAAQRQLIELACCLEVSSELRFVANVLMSERHLTKAARSVLLPGITDATLRKEISRQNWLIQSGFLKAEKGSTLPTISNTWIEFFMSTDTGNPTQYFFVTMCIKEVSNNQLARLEAVDERRLSGLLSKACNAKTLKPTHVLVYGKAGLDKFGVVQDLLDKEGLQLLKPFPDIDQDALPSVVMACFLAESRRKRRTARVFVLPKAGQVLTRDKSGFWSEFFGLEIQSDEEELLDEKLLQTNVVAVWIQGNTSNLHSQVLNAFHLHIEAKGASQAQTRAALEAQIDATGLSENTRMTVARIEGLSQQTLRTALDTAGRLHRAGSQAFETTLVDLLNKAQKAAGFKKNKQAEIPTKYDLGNINARGRFSPALITQSLLKTRRGSICLYGLPGTGKTQFARHLGKELGIPVLEYKASSLLDKYIGESEKNISKMFAEATEQGALLFLDEGDTFLRSRQLAERSWEVSMVNELLQQMEAFEGIFVLATNLFRHLDEAALRRFVFKLEFMALSESQRIQMFEVEAGVQMAALPEDLKNQYIEELALMRNLTPGDFATVKRQAQILDVELTPKEFLEQLAMEVDYKNEALAKENVQMGREHS